MADPIEYLNSLFASAPDDRIVLWGLDANVTASTGEEIHQFLHDESGILYADSRVTPLTNEQHVAFFHTVLDNSQPDEWQDMTLRPTVAMHHGGTTLLYYALEQAVEPQTLESVYAELGISAEDALPIPGVGEWEVVHYDPEIYYPIDTILDTFSTVPGVSPAVSGEAPPWEVESFGNYYDARLLTPYDPTLPEYQQVMTFAEGSNKLSTNWKNVQMKISDFISVLARHPEGKQKDGPGFVMGEIVGKQRRKAAVTHCYGVGLDIDVGILGYEVDEALRNLGCLALRYTTFSHRKTTSKLHKDKLLKWCKKNDVALTTESVVRYLREESKWDERVLASAVYVDDMHEEDGLKVVVEHVPMEKHRIVVPLAEAFEPGKVAATHAEGMAMWAKVCKALARYMGDLPMDNSTTDPSRLFYFPRHPKGGEFETTLFGGPLLDWRSLQLDEEQAVAPAGSWEEALVQEANKPSSTGGKGSRSKTEEGKNLGRWAMKRAHGFQIAEVIRDYSSERIRTNGAMKIDIECPFDEEHSNPGDPEDRGCFAVNAGDGNSEIFTIKCQHDSCQSFTNIDFLGKMLKDGWFDDTVLEDEMYNAATPEDAPNPQAAVRIAVEDDARAEYEKLIADLTEDSSDAEVDDAMRAMVEADLSGRALQRAESDIRKKVGMTQAQFSRLSKSIRSEIAKERNAKGDLKDPKGRIVFSFQGEFHFDEAVDSCFNSLLQTNKNDGEPVFSCVQDKPVRLTRDSKSGRISFDELTNRTLWSELNKRITFVRRNDNNDGSRASVPRDVADHVYEQSYAELPQSPEIIYTPLFTHEGHLIVQPGYYEDLGILMADTGFEIEVPELPTPDEVEDAVALLRDDLLVDFPFLDYDLAGNERREPSEASALAMLITPFMRRMISGNTPVFFVAKPTPGTGGTLLGKVPMLIFDGQSSAPLRYTSNEEEMQKALLSAIIETRSHLFFDDVKEFNNRVLLMALTNTEIGGRVLGSTRSVSRPNVFNWIATGNNPNVGNEMDRRICWVRLNAKTVDIQRRTYRHADLGVYIAENRAKIIRAILTLVQYWIDMGMPLYEERKLASFEDWSRKVGGVLQLAGIEGFLDNRAIKSGDMDETANKAFIKEWLKRYNQQPTLAAELFQYATDMGLDIIEGNNDDQKKNRFPRRLHTLEGRVFTVNGTDYLVKTGIDAEENTTYYLEVLHMDVA